MDLPSAALLTPVIYRRICTVVKNVGASVLQEVIV